MRTKNALVSVVLLSAGCLDSLSKSQCCDGPDGPQLVLEMYCADPLPSTQCEDQQDITDPHVGACQAFCDFENDVCDGSDDCFASCVIADTVPSTEVLDCAARATSCAGIEPCWALFTGAPP